MRTPYCKRSDKGKASSTQFKVPIQSVLVTSFMRIFMIPTQKLGSKYQGKFLFFFS